MLTMPCAHKLAAVANIKRRRLTGLRCVHAAAVFIFAAFPLLSIAQSCPIEPATTQPSAVWTCSSAGMPDNCPGPPNCPDSSLSALVACDVAYWNSAEIHAPTPQLLVSLNAIVPDPGAAPSALEYVFNTLNSANVFGNPVTSYLTQDIHTGAPVVVNVTRAGGPLSPGYVARTVTNGVAHTYGEGLDPAQSPWLTGLGANYAAEQLLWGAQMQQMINNAPSQCGCSN